MTQQHTAPKSRSKTQAPSKTLPQSAEPSAPPPEEPLYTLAYLSSQLPAPKPALLLALAKSHSDEQCLSIGRSISSAKVLSDGARIVSAAFFHLQRPEPKVQALLLEVGLTAPLLGATVYHLSALQDLVKQYEQTEHASESLRHKVKSAAEQTRARALQLRDAAWSMVQFVSRPNASLSAKVAGVATGTGTASELARQIVQLADVAELALHYKDDAVAALVTARGLSAEHIQRWRAEALATEQSEQAQRAQPVSASVAQIELDRTDGLVVLLLRELLRMLELAGKQDTSIRRIQLYTLSALLGRRPSRSTAQPLPDPAPALTPPNTPANAPVVAAPVSH